ncbi:sodium-coupled monocarboxylate transporter 2 isoform X2 [Pieris brassicae]|uniref:sodium-coupled monocarboxylate transporter 2 isoform X2 n=1 Tax=Pieris brassicae TaxID=7116 RepID=UPI001E661518|nr:sodium-coupled monocarboxylate transporter 2 isoform X2 [Pieris brassicae]
MAIDHFKRRCPLLKLTLNKLVIFTTTSCIFAAASASTVNVSTSINNTSSGNETDLSELFHWQDYGVLAAMLFVSCAIGVFYGYCGEKQTTGDDFLLGGSSMGTFPMALSLAASFVTAIELLGNPAEMYIAGAQFWMICIAFVLVVPISSQLYLPVFMRLRLTSCYEYLEVRFCKSMRVYASALYMLQMILYTAVAVYAPALALSDVTGLNTYVAVSLVYVVCIFYASQGGMKAVIMTDSFQSAVLLASLATILALGANQVGGLNTVWDYSRRSDRLHLFDMDPDPTVRHSFWSVVIGGTMYWVSMFCANQASVQKYLSVERISQARIALWVSAIGLIAVYSVNFITGAVLAAHYAGCDPIQAGVISASDRLLPLYVVREFGKYPGIPGFFVAGIFAASLGTVASALNSLAAVACQDLANGLLGITLPEEKGAMGAVAGSIFGLLVVVVAGGGAQLAQVPLPRLPTSTDSCPAYYNLTTLSISPSENQDEAVFWLFKVSYLWYSSLGCVATILAGMVVSVITGVTDPAHVPIDLISPPVISLLSSLPKKIKKALRIPTRMGLERRRSSSVRPPSIADDKDTRRRRRLSELAGGVFYSDAQILTQGHDNLALDTEKSRDHNHRTSFKLDTQSSPQLSRTSTC